MELIERLDEIATLINGYSLEAQEEFWDADVTPGLRRLAYEIHASVLTLKMDYVHAADHNLLSEKLGKEERLHERTNKLAVDAWNDLAAARQGIKAALVILFPRHGDAFPPTADNYVIELNYGDRETYKLLLLGLGIGKENITDHKDTEDTEPTKEGKNE